MSTVGQVMTALTATSSVTRKYSWPAENVQAPCVVAGYPELDLNVIFVGGKIAATYPLWVLVGKVSERAARDALDAYIVSEPALFKGSTLGGVVDYANLDSMRVEEVKVADVPYLALKLTISVMQ